MADQTDKRTQAAQHVADGLTEAWISRFPRIDERGLRPRLLAALQGMCGSPDTVSRADLDDIEVIAAALVEHVAMLKALTPEKIRELPTMFSDALKGNGKPS